MPRKPLGVTGAVETVLPNTSGLLRMFMCPFCNLPLTKPVERCPSCHADLSNTRNIPVPAPRSGGTLIESPGAFSMPGAPSAQGQHPATGRQAVPAAPPARAGINKKNTGAGAEPKPIAVADAAVPFRPVNSPPVLNLCLLDAGSREEGEWFRLRDRRFVIGRAEGDLVLPHDNGLSGRHAELVRRTHNDGYRFFLVDLQSTNGSFVRVAKLLLRPGQELLIGGRRYLFDGGKDSESSPKPTDDDGTPNATISWQSKTSSATNSALPALVELTADGTNVRRIPFESAEIRIGCDPSQCNAIISGDPFVSSLHAIATPGGQNRWQIRNANALNGLWLRVAEMPLDGNAEFQLGEQRFLVRPQR